MSRKPTSITGRDGYIVNQALLYAIAHIQSLPPEKQEWSNMRDMCAIVRAHGSFFTLNQSWSVEHHTGIIPNLWPEPEEELTNEDRAAREEFETNRRNLVEMMQRVARSWEEAVSATEEAEADFIEGGPFPNAEPEFVEMTPEDEASIQGKAA